MSDDIDDFDSDDFGLEGFDDGFDDSKSTNTLADLWKNNAFVKIGVILLGIGLLILIFMLFSGKKEPTVGSSLNSPAEVTQTPGSAEVSEKIKNALEEENTRRLEDALRNSGSVVPMPVNTSKGQIPFEEDAREEEDPLDRWRRLQEEKVERAIAKEPEISPEEPEVDTRTPAIQALSQAMSGQMEAILGNQTIEGAQTRQVANLEYLEGLQRQEEERLEAERTAREEAASQTGDGNTNNQGRGEILLPAGSIEYAQLLNEANTDVPGPILAQIVTGPFEGARLIGTFEETYNYLTLNFDTVVLDGVDYSVDAVAIDPKTTLPGVVTNINRRYFTRVVLPVAAEFISGFAEALGNTGTTTITIAGDSVTESTSNDFDDEQQVALGVSRAGEELSAIVNEIQDNNPQLLRVRSGTPIGILFIDSVTENSTPNTSDSLEPLQSFQQNGNNTDNDNN